MRTLKNYARKGGVPTDTLGQHLSHEVLPWFSSIVRQMPGPNLMQSRGTARTSSPNSGAEASPERPVNSQYCQPGFNSQAANQPKYHTTPYQIKFNWLNGRLRLH